MDINNKLAENIFDVMEKKIKYLRVIQRKLEEEIYEYEKKFEDGLITIDELIKWFYDRDTYKFVSGLDSNYQLVNNKSCEVIFNGFNIKNE